jgi:uncharacterized protein YfkK (UPF0435 family)
MEKQIIKTITDKSFEFYSLHHRKLNLYIEKQNRKMVQGSWSEDDEIKYNVEVDEINTKIKFLNKSQFDTSAHKAVIESEINKIVEKAERGIEAKVKEIEEKLKIKND